MQACEGAETCIVSCHKHDQAWGENEYHQVSYLDGENRASKLSEITGLNLTDLNIDENDVYHCNVPGYVNNENLLNFKFIFIIKVNFFQTRIMKKHVSTKMSTLRRTDLLFFQTEKISL